MKAERRRYFQDRIAFSKGKQDKINVPLVVLKRDIQQRLNENRNDPHQEMSLLTGQHAFNGWS